MASAAKALDWKALDWKALDWMALDWKALDWESLKSAAVAYSRFSVVSVVGSGWKVVLQAVGAPG
jgi:hypothetical protein